ncbi:hypothetical protein HZ320_03035 [[Pasteurella] aerogenes]|nr:hypothetical protein HZ320_01105 [[Pasteurella] aerogenes]UWZ92702.1 hypothetical protein HZ320_03035 [[Pasteurella] aerogenes]
MSKQKSSGNLNSNETSNKTQCKMILSARLNSEKLTWQLYEEFKKRLREQNLTQKQYEQRINEALEVLGL